MGQEGTVTEKPKKYVGRGGWRGGGRPRIDPEDSQKRPNHGMRAWPDEWDLIRRFQKCVVKAPARSKHALEELEKAVLGFQNPPEGEK